MTTKQYFLTGGSGYICRNLIRFLVDQGHSVTALARSNDSAACVEALGARAFRADILADNLIEGMNDCQVLIHAAADTDHDNLSTSQYRTNVDGTTNVLHSARKAGIKKTLYISTESVLLEGRPLRQATEDHPIPKRAIGEYSRSKAAAEQKALAWGGDMASRLSRGMLRGPVTRQSLATSAVEITLDISKAKAQLGYRPVVSRAAGLAELKSNA